MQILRFKWLKIVRRYSAWVNSSPPVYLAVEYINGLTYNLWWYSAKVIESVEILQCWQDLWVSGAMHICSELMWWKLFVPHAIKSGESDGSRRVDIKHYILPRCFHILINRSSCTNVSLIIAGQTSRVWNCKCCTTSEHF